MTTAVILQVCLVPFEMVGEGPIGTREFGMLNTFIIAALNLSYNF